MTRLRIPQPVVDTALADLERPHPFAAERIGFFSTRIQHLPSVGPLVVVVDYHPIPDDDYVYDPMVGAKIGSRAIRAAMQRVLDAGCGAVHVHEHPHRGAPGMSRTDAHGIPPLADSFQRLAPDLAHGAVILSSDSAAAWLWLPDSASPVRPDILSLVGTPSVFAVPGGWPLRAEPGRYDRQSFLGTHAQDIVETVRLGIVGIGGGGSHVAQQAAHIGFPNVTAFDGDTTEDTNLNRLVTATTQDAERATPKAALARRVVEGLVERANVITHAGDWRERTDLLAACDVVIGCVDTFATRRDLEAACRRALIPYVDIGMDVHAVDGSPPRMAGQVVLSIPGGPCMRCLGFLTDAKLELEAAAYGDVGGRPQVVWPNGLLASTAVGRVMDLLTGWSGVANPVPMLSYDGNLGSLAPDPRLAYLSEEPCPHYPILEAGPVQWQEVAA